MFIRSFHSSISHQRKYYDILQLNHLADKRTIKSNYYKLSKKYHPDLNPNNQQAHKMFLEINEAYAVLGNEASKKKYDYDCSGGGGNASHMNSAAKYSRAGGSGGNTQAWHFRNRRPRSTGSTSAQEQAERMRNDQSGTGAGFNHNEHHHRHYEAEEARRRQRMANAAERKRAAGDESVPGKKAHGMENIWGRLWRLGIVLTGIGYAAQTIN